MQTGIFISIEGLDGVGKGSNLQFVQNWFESRSRKVMQTREPGGTLLGEKVRELLLSNSAVPILPMPELLLMFAARSQHVEEVIKPALLAGKVVLSDRFTDASFAYQGGGREMGSQKVEQLKKLILGDLKPNLTILLDAPLGVGLQRVGSRGQSDRFDKESDQFKTRVRTTYLQLAKNEPERFSIIDANTELDMVQYDIEKVLQARFSE